MLMSNFSSTIQNQIPTPNLPIKLQLGFIVFNGRCEVALLEWHLVSHLPITRAQKM